MPVRPTAAAAVVAALTVMSSPLRAQAPPAMSAEQGWNAIGQCAGNPNERARHACLDDVLRKAGLLTPQAEAKQRRQQFGLDENTARATPPPAPAAPAPAPAAKIPQPAPDDRVDVELAKAVVANDGKIVITTADGAVWKQTDSTTVPRLPDAGDHVRIRKASLGSYLCEMPTHHTFRCVRAK